MAAGHLRDGESPAAAVARLTAELAQEREAARLERERLTYELGHRVKNTLSVVQALAGQTFRADPAAAPAIQAFGQRITALARANDAILKESWTSATLEATARCVLAPHGEAPGTLTIEGPPLRIAASAALALAMAFHELATNAKRHGAWSRPGGAVDLSWQVSAAPDGEFALGWVETGGPVGTGPAVRGFGLRLVEQSLRSAFGRNVVLAFEPGGFAVRVRAPAAEVVA